MLKGITIILYNERKIGVDDLGQPIYDEVPELVHNVLVAPIDTKEQSEILNLTGARVDYQLAIPKGDTHDWRDKKVEFFSQSFKTIGIPIQGIDDLIPGPWNMKVKVARYE